MGKISRGKEMKNFENMKGNLKGKVIFRKDQGLSNGIDKGAGTVVDKTTGR